MNTVGIAAIAFVGIFAAVLLGMRLRVWLPDHHLDAQTKDSVRLAMGLVVTMTALLLGLLVASAKGSYDGQKGEVIQMAAKTAFLDRLLEVYGPETTEVRRLLRPAVEDTIRILWQEDISDGTSVDRRIAGGEEVFHRVQMLEPKNDMQRSLKAQAVQVLLEITRARWLLFAQHTTSIARPLVVMVVIWLAVIFLSFGLFAPFNKTVLTAMFIVALAVSSALFLILELDQPFDGLIQISQQPMRNTLDHLQR